MEQLSDLQKLSDDAWYIENFSDVVQPVATRKANSRGLHDLFGNAWEWKASGRDDRCTKTPEINCRNIHWRHKKKEHGANDF